MACPLVLRCAVQVMISALGDPEGKAKGGFVLLDHETFEVWWVGIERRWAGAVVLLLLP